MVFILNKRAAYWLSSCCAAALALGCTPAAKAVTYFFNAASFTYASTAPGNTGGFYSGSLSGSFDYGGSVTSNGPLTNVSVTLTNACTAFTSGTCSSVGSRTYTAGYWTTSLNYLFFTNNGPEPDVRFTLSGNLPATGGSVNLLPSTSLARSGWRSGVSTSPPPFDGGTARVDFSAVSGQLVPSPGAALMLTPLSSLLFMRKRYGQLTKRKPTTMAAD